MSVSDSVVRQLHQRLMQVADLQSQIDRGPRQNLAAQSQVDAAKVALQKCKDTIKQKRMEADRKQLQQRERENKLHDLTGKMNAAKNNREYQALKEQIAADTQANSVLSDEIFETLEGIDSLQASIRGLEEKVKFAEAERDKVAANVEQRLGVLRAELERVQSELSVMESSLPPDFSIEYKRLIGTRGIEALSPIDGQSCGGCYTNVPPKVLDKLRMGQPCLCPSCGRLLYRPES
jgi:predicted  nucleic acid-binding Zn-ribbon protein